MSAHMEIVDITGKTWIGDSAEEPLTAETYESLSDLLGDFKGLTHLSLEVGGNKHWFNPRHVIVASLVETGDDSPASTSADA